MLKYSIKTDTFNKGQNKQEQILVYSSSHAVCTLTYWNNNYFSVTWDFNTLNANLYEIADDMADLWQCIKLSQLDKNRLIDSLTAHGAVLK